MYHRVLHRVEYNYDENAQFAKKLRGRHLFISDLLYVQEVLSMYYMEFKIGQDFPDMQCNVNLLRFFLPP